MLRPYACEPTLKERSQEEWEMHRVQEKAKLPEIVSEEKNIPVVRAIYLLVNWCWNPARLSDFNRYIRKFEMATPILIVGKFTYYQYTIS